MAVRAGVLRSAEKAAELGGELGASSGEAPTQLTPTPVSVSRKVIATRTPAPSTPSVASGSPPSPFGKAHRNSTANLSWMERAALFEEQLGLARRPSVVIREEAPPPRDEPAPAEVPTPVAEEPTLTSEEPTLTRDEPTLTNEESTLTRDEPTLTNEEPTLPSKEPTLTQDEPTLTREDRTLEYEVKARAAEPQQTEPAPRETPLSSEVDIPDFRPYRFGRAKLLAAFGVAVALVIGSMASRQFASRSEPAASTRSRPRPEPAPSLAAPTNAPTDTARALEPAPAAMALEPSETRVPSVTVDMLPKAPRHAGPRSKSKPNRR
ncbi:MAG TPA: hypothetical protein VNN72_06440 [Polyangiaceae bacterium]|nr:hypothetical protein [Polyangiaceae bacterium]